MPTSRIPDFRVLVVEDDKEQCAALLRALSALSPECACTCAAGLERLSAEPQVHAVLLDLDLPDSSGAATVQRFLLSYPNVPIVVMTGESYERLSDRDLILAGAQEVLRKPYAFAQVRPALVTALARHEVRGQFHGAQQLLNEIRKDHAELKQGAERAKKALEETGELPAGA